MKRVLLIARRELVGYFNSFYGWAVLALMLMLDGLFFNAYTLGGSRSSSEVVSLFFYTNFGVTLAASVFVTMRSFAAEREQRTLVLLQTSPASDWEVVLGKYLGAYGFVLVTVLAALYMPLMVYFRGQLQWGQLTAGYLGILLCAGLSVAIGIFGSTLAPNQLLAGVLAGFLVTLQVLFWLLSGVTDAPFDAVFSYVDLYQRHFEPFQDGAVHLRTLVYAPSAAFLFLLASVRVLQSRRWR
jgi:ABC-2 type transport system permease protein